MAYEKKNGDTVLFPQHDKKNEKAPDMKGEILWNGETLEIALWSKQGSRGEFYAGMAKVKGDRPVADASRSTNPSYGSGNAMKDPLRGYDDGDIPFMRMF